MYSYFRLRKEKTVSLLGHDLFTREHTIISMKSITVLEISTHCHLLGSLGSVFLFFIHTLRTSCVTTPTVKHVSGLQSCNLKELSALVFYLLFLLTSVGFVPTW